MTQNPSAPEQMMQRIMTRLDAIECKLDAISATAEAAQATVVDVADERIADLRARGVDVDARGRALLELLERLTAPETTAALHTLIGALPQAAVAADALPKGLATAVDAFDDFVAGLCARGVDVDALFGNMVTVATRVSNVLESPEFTALMRSGVLDPRTLAVIGSAGEALAATHRAEIPRVGLLGAVKASGDPDTQRLLGFALTFARHFGHRLEGPPRGVALPPAGS